MNRVVKERLLLPIGIPLGALILIAVVVILFSRVLLAVPPLVAVAVALMAALNILAACAVVASGRRLAGVDAAVLGGVIFVPVVAGIAIASGVIPMRAHEEGEEKPAIQRIDLAAANVAFDHSEIRLRAGGEVNVHFANNDNVPHNLAIYRTPEATEVIFKGRIIDGGTSTDYGFEAPSTGSYFFRCDVHPSVMTGTVVVEAAPPERPAGPVGPVALQITAQSIAFDQQELRAPPDTEVEVHFTNNDTVPHNVSFYQSSDLKGVIFRRDPFAGPRTVTYSFRTPGPGSYYFHCDVHPNMNGTFVVG